MSLELELQLHQAAFQANQPQTVYALVDLKPGALAARMPLDLRLVLDVSGSMSSQARKGDRQSKLDLMKKAAMGMVETLQPGDHLAIVAFDHEARQVFEGAIAGEADRQAACDKLKRLRESGGTSILAGLEAAVGQPTLPGHVGRAVLVTDGEGEAGEEPACQRLAFDQRGQLTWLVYGIGTQYNDVFLDSLAAANGGQYAHISDMHQAVAAFKAEAAVMGEIALAGLVLTVEPEPGIELVRADRIVPQTLPLPVHLPQFFSADLGDLDRVRGQKVLLQLSVPALAAGVQLLARLRCGYHVPALKLLNQQAHLPLVATFAAEAGGSDPEVLRTVTLAGAGRLYTLGLAEAAQGAGDAAVRTLGSAAGLYDQLGLVGMSQQLVTLTSGLANGGMDEDVKRTLTTMARQAWQQGGHDVP